MTSTGDDDSEFGLFSDNETTRDEVSGQRERRIKRSDSDLDEEDLEFTDDDSERENRFTGSSSNWRLFTQDERALAASLDQQQADDLSLHLYCAHALKARVRNAESEDHGRKSSHEKIRKADNDGGSYPFWCPDVAWTAWPMKPEDLPKAGERFGVPSSGSESGHITTYKKGEAGNSDVSLQEEIEALMIKKATAQFRKDTIGHLEKVEEIQCLIDDEKARDVLEPSVQMVRSQVDDLLWRLQSKGRSRVGKRKRAQSGSTRSRSASGVRARSLSTIRRGTAISREFVEHGESDSTEGNESEEEGKLETGASYAGRSYERKPKHLKGWKEVLEAATLVGLDLAAVQRATSRCTALFGEEMERPSFYDCPIETCNRHGQPFEKAWRWREHLRRTHKYALADVYDIEASLKSLDGSVLDDGRSSVDADEDPA